MLEGAYVSSMGDVKPTVQHLPPLPPDLPPDRSERSGPAMLPNFAAAGGEPIAPNLGIDYAFPPHLEYAYPPPDGNILTNIVNALIAVPRFYTQVLHLMNKMNLPAPFRPALPTPPLPPPAPPQTIPKRQAGDLSSGESEMESSEEEDDGEKDDLDNDPLGLEGDTEKRGSSRKRLKREAILGPALDKGASHEAAGVKAIDISKGLTAIKKKAPVLQIKIVPKGLGKESGAGKSKEADIVQPEVVEEPEEQRTIATRAELEAGKLKASDMLSLPIFKNYSPGNATQVLYIKNLAKDVTREDLYYVYGAFFSSKSDVMAQLTIKLMQEGRMRGQAFVDWPSIDLAKSALAGTHGYVLKGKPMVVQFGRNEAASKLSSGGTS